jgi:co-chaperonin GroES (HSP10)
MAVKGKVTPLGDKVLVSNMNFDEQKTKGGIILRSDDGKSEGVHPRWCRVWAIGPEQKDVKVGEWLLMEHGRWTRGIDFESDSGERTIIRMVDNKGILLVSDDEPADAIIGAFETPKHGSSHSPEDFMRM